MAADAVAGYIKGLLEGKKFRRTTYALDRASREAALTRLFEQSISSENSEANERIAENQELFQIALNMRPCRGST
jgi:hypothetical protein